MQILEDDDERPSASEALEKPSHRPEELAGGCRALAPSEQLGDSLGHDACLLVALEEAFDRRLGVLRRNLPHDLGERDIRRSFAIGHAAADERGAGLT